MAFATVTQQFARIVRLVAGPGSGPRGKRELSDGSQKTVNQGQRAAAPPAFADTTSVVGVEFTPVRSSNATVERELTMRAAIMAGWGPTLRLKFLTPAAARSAMVLSGVGLSGGVLIWRLAGSDVLDALTWMMSGR